MEQQNPPEEHEEQTQEDGNDRRSFLTRAALGVAGAAGMVALSSQTGRAAEAGNSAKSRIVDKIKMQMAAQDDFRKIDDGGGDGSALYSKNSHSLYLKA